MKEIVDLFSFVIAIPTKLDSICGKGQVSEV